jgi:O-antigen ligase/Tfp pilus assembly protein PilF
MDKLQKTIFWLFAALLFFVPMVLWPTTSEVFEFNKIVLTYGLTTLIVGVWSIRCILKRKFIFRRTILDIPLLVFLGSQLISTLLSIDPLTSWLGYYSRFNGGMISILCYSLLYWAFVSNLDSKSALRTLYFVLSSAVLVSTYGILEHFGIDKNLWVQDVQSRVFSTLGQPNWLAAWLVALMPITWALMLSKSRYLYFGLSVLFFITLLFTKSRSGILGFAAADLTFWAGYVWLNRKEKVKTILSPLIISNLSFVFLALIIGTQFTPSINSIISKSANTQIEKSSGPALEVGGTESGTIRKIVWKGAVEVWKHYPVFGTGVETFAYSYYKFRPAEHNLVSEWDFIYNKAHNEYLNMAANTGSIGLISYLFLIGFSTYGFIRNSKNGKSMESDKWQMINFGLLAGYISLLVTNFFGFSVVPTQLQLFLFPAFAITLNQKDIEKAKNQKQKADPTQKVLVAILLTFTLYLLLAISRYWHADYLFSMGRNYESTGKSETVVNYLGGAIKLEPKQALYHNELANVYTTLALNSYQEKNAEKVKEYSGLAISESQKAIDLSPANVNYRRSRFGVFVRLAIINPQYLLAARDTLEAAIKNAPTDAKLYYNLGLTYARIGEADKALDILKKTIELKANYKEARLAYAFLLIDKRENKEAKAQLEYILKFIDPNDSLTKQTLEGIR